MLMQSIIDFCNFLLFYSLFSLLTFNLFVKNGCPYLTTLLSGSPIIKAIRIEKLAYQGECRRLLLGGLPRGQTQCEAPRAYNALDADRSIIQNGKLVGAVTHVFINDPTTGYGIFIENMLNASNIPMAKAS